MSYSYKKQRIKKSSIIDLVSKNIFFTIFVISFSTMPISAMLTMDFPSNLFLLIFLAVGIGMSIPIHHDIIKYGILRQPYEYYIIISTSYSSNKTVSKKYKGSQIGLPDKFSDLTKEENHFLAIGVYNPQVLMSQQIRNCKDKVPQQKPPIVLTIIPIIISILFSIMFSSVFISMLWIQSTPLTAISIFLIIQLIVFIVVFIVVLNLIKKDKIINNTNKSNDPYAKYDTNKSKYNIEDLEDTEDDPFADFYKK